jgi:hypothetical protein
MSTVAATVEAAGAIAPLASGSVGPFSEVHASSASVAQADSTAFVRIADLLLPTRERTQVIGNEGKGVPLTCRLDHKPGPNVVVMATRLLSRRHATARTAAILAKGRQAAIKSDSLGGRSDTPIDSSGSSQAGCISSRKKRKRS